MLFLILSVLTAVIIFTGYAFLLEANMRRDAGLPAIHPITRRSKATYYANTWEADY